MGLMLGISSAVLFGLMCILIGVFRGSAKQQNIFILLGAGFSSLLGGFFIPQATFPPVALAVGTFVGLVWGLGQYFQLNAYRAYGLSRTMPLSTGIHLSINGLSGLLIFHEWETASAKFWGITALLTAILGIFLSSWKEKTTHVNPQQFRVGLINTVISGLLFGTYTPLLRWFEVPAHSSIMPLGIGLLLYAFLAIFLVKDSEPSVQFWHPRLWGLSLSGIVWSIGNIFLLLAVDRIGVATAFSLSQTSVAISTLSGIIFLGETRTRKELPVVLLGVTAIVLAGVFLSFTQI